MLGSAPSSFTSGLAASSFSDGAPCFGPTSPSSFDNFSQARQYPWDLQGYQNQPQEGANQRPSLTNRSFAQAVEQARANCKTCQVAQPDLGPIGCAIVGGGDPEVYQHRLSTQTRQFPGDSFIAQNTGPIYITPAASVFQTHQVTPRYGDYKPTLFQTPYDRSDSLISTGTMVNAYTGEVLNTFEEAMPPPNTNKAIDADSLKRTNPFLVWMNGGKDPNAPLPSKTEVCQMIPGPDGGPNVWGTQLYAGELQKRIKQIVNRDIWNNRNGDYSTELSLAKEQPAGYVGLQPAYRAIPWLPATNVLDNHGWTGIVNDEGRGQGGLLGQVTTTKLDMTACNYLGLPNGANGTYSMMTIPGTEHKPTFRGSNATYYVTNAQDQNTGQWVLQDKDLKMTLKQQMEHAFPTRSAADPSTGQYTVNDTQLRNTMKTLMSQPFAPGQAQNQDTGSYNVLDTSLRPTHKTLMSQGFAPSQASSPQTGSYTVNDTQLRPTMKNLMTQSFGVHGAQSQHTGPYTVNDTDLRFTQKTLMQNPFGAFSAAHETSGGYTVNDTDLRSTQKTLMQHSLNPGQAQNQETGSYTVNDTDLRSTQKTLMQNPFAPFSASDPSTGSYTVNDTDLRSTQKTLMQNPFAVFSASDPSTGSYTVNDTNLKPTSKTLMQNPFAPFTAADQTTGSWIEFQGPLKENYRMFYDNVPLDPFVSGGPEGGAVMTGDNVGPGQSFTRQFRGECATDWFGGPEKHFNNMSDMYIGESQRDTRRQFEGYMGPANFTQADSTYLNTSPWISENHVPCRYKSGNVDDQFLSVRNQQMLQGQ